MFRSNGIGKIEIEKINKNIQLIKAESSMWQ
jgi:hypothetical protein